MCFAGGGTLRGLRARLLAVPSRLRASLPHLSASDVALIDREIRNTLEGLAHGDD
jgi:phage terminase Nu1 subunit (DNA packaging protein)